MLEQGIASPGDEFSHADAYAHNAGDTWTSRLTAWMTDPEVAEDFAGKKGVNLQTIIEEMQTRGVNNLWSPDAFDENDVLLEGRIEGLQVAGRAFQKHFFRPGSADADAVAAKCDSFTAGTRLLLASGLSDTH